LGTESGLRIYKELAPMKKGQVDLDNKVIWIPDSKTPNGVAEVPLTGLAVAASGSDATCRGQPVSVSQRERRWPSDNVQDRLAADTAASEGAVFRIYALRSTCATRLSAGGVADEWVTQLLRQGDAKVFKKYSQMKLQVNREALQKLNRTANESTGVWYRPDDDPGILEQ
jgi:integrase